MVTNGGSNGKPSTTNAKNDETAETATETADIEKAISVTGYGTFNVLLLMAALPIAWTGIFDTTSTAFVLASAECDLRLTFLRKGVLVASPFLGIVFASFLWDHLLPYIGMRNLFVLGLLADAVLNLLGSAVDSYYAFLAIKILSGILVAGPFSMVIAYLSEFHSAKYKASFARWAGLAINVAIIGPAVIAIIILPLPLIVNVFNRRYPAWRVYLLICSSVPVLGLLASGMLPQSPKYLVQIGKPEEALRLLRRIYSVNKRKPANTFPIKELLVSEVASLSCRPFFEANSQKIRLACYNAKLLLSSTHLPAVAFLGFLQFGSMLGFNTMRLWVPYLFIILNNFNYENWTKDRSPTICEMLDRRMSVPAKEYLNCPDFENMCIAWNISGKVYGNSAIIAFSAVFFSFLVGTVSTSTLRKRTILLAAFALSVGSCFGINWAQLPPYMLTLASTIIVTTRITGNIVSTVNVDVIPIPLRSTSLNLLNAIGNVAAVLGNIVFSVLLDAECLVAFVTMGSLLIACFCLSFFHPKPVSNTLPGQANETKRTKSRSSWGSGSGPKELSIGPTRISSR